MKKLFLIASIMFLVVGVAGIASATLITNGDFNTGLSDWNPSGNYYLGTDGSHGNSAVLNPSGQIYQTLLQPTISGHTYTVNFDLKGYAGSALTVSAFSSLPFSDPNNRIATQNYGIGDNLVWEHADPFHFVGTGSDVIVAFANNSNKLGVVDNVRAHAPEPATMLLLGTGLIGLAGVGRKKFFRKTT